MELRGGGDVLLRIWRNKGIPQLGSVRWSGQGRTVLIS